MRIAFYKGTDPGVLGLADRFVRWFMRGKYSHVELVFSDGVSASSSGADGGVRFKTIDLTPDDWDVFTLHGPDESTTRQWFTDHHGQPYDWLGDFGFVWRPTPTEKGKWFCSEAVAAALGFPEPWRFDPNALASAIEPFLNDNH